MSDLQIKTAEVFEPLLDSARYKGIHGGRGSAKSNFFAEDLIDRCIRQKTDWVCLREVQRTLDQSVKKLIESKIEKFGVGHLFDPQQNKIKTPYGGVIIFMGMQDHTASSIKSLEGFDGAWFEEAQTMSERSLKLLRPTLRKPGSELWFSWNPEQPTDPIDKFLRGKNKPDSLILVQANYYDNPWFPDELEQERLLDLRTNELYHAHVWLGEYDTDGTNNVYHYFNRQKHHTDRTITNNDKYLHIGQDFNVGACCSTVFVIDSGYPVIVDEFISHDTRDLCIQLSSRYPNKHISIYPDASGQSRHTNASESDIDILRAAGFTVMVNGMNPAIRDRINAFNGLLAHDKIKINTNTCPNLTHALESQGYDKKGMPEKLDEHPSIDDWCDSAGYCIAFKWPVAGIGGVSRLTGY